MTTNYLMIIGEKIFGNTKNKKHKLLLAVLSEKRNKILK